MNEGGWGMKWKSVTIGQIAVQDRTVIPPDSLEASARPYLGLEQIESQTGTILSYDSDSVEGKSTTFAFDVNHVLYGKLRPYLNKVALPQNSGRCSTEIIPLLPIDVDREFLAFLLKRDEIVQAAMLDKTGSRMPRADMNALLAFEVRVPVSLNHQRLIAAHLKSQLTTLEQARTAAQLQLTELINLANAIIRQSVEHPDTAPAKLGDVLDEVKKGVGKTWAEYPVLGATRAGLALAKDPVGKIPERYKPVLHGTVFYNPMRIMIGSIAMVDEFDTPGITSPDYVALRGKEGLVDSRWFYYWLRSPYGVSCIASLARGAVRERMLFNRLAEGSIELPSYTVQVTAAKALAELKPMRSAIEKQLAEINLLPGKILAKAFNS